MKNIYITSIVSLVTLNGCQTIESITPEKMSKLSSPNDLVLKMKLNGSDNKGKDYIYLWHNGGTRDPQSLIPKKSFSLYCESQNGEFVRIESSPMDQVQDQSARNLLKKYKVDEAVGGFRCNLPNYKSWGVLIEPLGEQKINSNVYTSRMVTPKTEIMSYSDITSFYFKRQVQKDIEQSRQQALNEKYQAQKKAK